MKSHEGCGAPKHAGVPSAMQKRSRRTATLKVIDRNGKMRPEYAPNAQLERILRLCAPLIPIRYPVPIVVANVPESIFRRPIA